MKLTGDLDHIRRPVQRLATLTRRLSGGKPSPPLANVIATLLRFETPSSARSAAMQIWNGVRDAQHYVPLVQFDHDRLGGNLWDLCIQLRYHCHHPPRSRRTPMDVQIMVARWVPIIKTLALAHDKAAIDRVEYQSEDYMRPLLDAPVAQVRHFFALLVRTLKSDPEVPLFLWSWFDVWHDGVLRQLPDGQVHGLQQELAEEVAALAEKDVQPDVRAALVGALRWRDAATLTAMKAKLAKGEKARMVGRESCLFLEVGDETVML